jgi:acetyl-CoA C-acetyltransferase
LLLRQPFHASNFDEVILGCVAPAPSETNIARIVALRLGCGERVPAWTVQRNCGSGLQAIECAYRNIASGRTDLALAGGVEAMSHTPLLLSEPMVSWLADWRTSSGWRRYHLLARLRPSHLKPVIALLEGLTDPITGLSMGQTAENLAHRFKISRERMDAYACESHRRLRRAQTAGYLMEIEPLFVPAGTRYDADDGMRADASMEKLAALKPVFDRPYGSVTAGNSAQVSDGAAWVILASESAVKTHDLHVRCRIVDCAWAGVDPAQMGLGPVHAVPRLLQRQGWSAEAIDYWEINEAFAAQVLACLTAWTDRHYCQQELGLDGTFGEIAHERLNVDGGAISLGHPIGASGARIVLHLLEVLQRNKARRGVATLCVGGGQGGAMLLERVAD